MSKSKNKNRGQNKFSKYQSLLPDSVIKAAISGDRAAIYEIVDNYANYILQFVRQDYYSRDGHRYRENDISKSDIMKSALMRSFPTFEYIP
ncbi:MAG: helix-turn-helix domain-containing protein [Oscillospiraceae bacterium]|nr:helix-turn-helix domain-containing protein [Oscillospiraceae bacterium]